MFFCQRHSWEFLVIRFDQAKMSSVVCSVTAAGPPIGSQAIGGVDVSWPVKSSCKRAMV